MPDNPFMSPERDEPSRRDLWQDVTWALFSFEGRMNRTQCWGGFVVVWCCAFVSIAGAGFLGGLLQLGEAPVTAFALVVFGLYIWMSLAMRVKRWHDLGYSGFAVFVNFIPYVGALIEFVMTGFLPGSPQVNSYGAPPMSGSGGSSPWEA